MKIVGFLRTTLVAITLIFSFSELLSQRSILRSQEVYSQNGRYCVTVTGHYYEGFVGDQKICLMDMDNHDTLWVQSVPRRFLILPSVSNNGDVAITRREIQVFDKKGRIKGVMSLKPNESPFAGEDYENTVQGFSPAADRYYIFTRSPDNYSDVVLVSLSDSAKEIWRKDIGVYKPQEILLYGDKIITHDCGYAGIDYTNFCYIFDRNGNTVWQHQTDCRRPSDCNVRLDREHGRLILKDRSTETEVKLDSLDYHKH